MKTDHWRGLDFYKPSSDKNKVLIVGCGHTGSFLAYGLARLGVKKITVCDHDKVEPHNLPNQFYAESLLKDFDEENNTILKVVALKKSIELMVNGVEIEMIMNKVQDTPEEVLSSFNVVIFGVDSMSTRQWLWSFYKDKANLIIDPRTGGEFARVFAIKPNDILARGYYETTLHGDSDAVDLPCTGRAVIDVAMNVAGECVQRYRKFVSDKLLAMETFHDYAIGNHGIMNTYSVREFRKGMKVELLPSVGNHPAGKTRKENEENS